VAIAVRASGGGRPSDALAPCPAAHCDGVSISSRSTIRAPSPWVRHVKALLLPVEMPLSFGAARPMIAAPTSGHHHEQADTTMRWHLAVSQKVVPINLRNPVRKAFLPFMVFVVAVGEPLAGESTGPASYACGKYKTKYARANCVEFEASYNECIAGRANLSITCGELRKKDAAWLSKNDVAANDKAATSGKGGGAGATCSDSEYRIYQQYDRFLDANPSIPDYELRRVFARRVAIQPDALKNLYTRCVMRWSEQNPAESRAHRQKSLEDFARDCAQRPANDPYCSSVFGR